MVKVMNAGGNPNVIAEARAKRKSGGGVCAPEGAKAKGRMDRPNRARGGSVAAGGGLGTNQGLFSSARSVVSGRKGK